MSNVESQAEGGSPFWRFSLAFYRRPGIAETCLELQDGAGVDVNLLLFLLWRACARRALSGEAVRRLDETVGPWREAAVVPLRRLRRTLKGGVAPIEPGTAELFRTRIKAMELEAERLEQGTLYDLSRREAPGDEVASPAEAARISLASYETLIGRRFPQAAVEKLLAALAEFETRET
ncbi:MAG TPA: TIGR02444 family protein [Xanthobacteraceae bacterium]|jgi:uncharacterized protein (TIGR02444 family)|nr:TIGR02444 family protein [Xanthobacteraceae bacterium]